jgi:hypothetical protein
MVPSFAVSVDLALEMRNGGTKYHGKFFDVERAAFLELRTEFESLLVSAE